MHGLIMATVTIQYLKSKYLNSTSDCSPFCTPLNPNRQLDLWNIYEIMTTSCHFTTVTLGQARITSHWIVVMVSPLISLLLSPSSLFSTHRQSKLLKVFISSSHSSNNSFPSHLELNASGLTLLSSPISSPCCLLPPCLLLSALPLQAFLLFLELHTMSLLGLYLYQSFPLKSPHRFSHDLYSLTSQGSSPPRTFPDVFI